MMLEGCFRFASISRVRIIHKAKHYGAIYEGTKVFVKFESGVKDKRPRSSPEEDEAKGSLDIPSCLGGG